MIIHVNARPRLRLTTHAGRLSPNGMAAVVETAKVAPASAAGDFRVRAGGGAEVLKPVRTR